ncbi:MAG: dihydrofolate reductase family protein [Desulfurococcales archaeon]|nr:dihydrofolate reductase family protein [Desulfurococcales archaeon]
MGYSMLSCKEDLELLHSLRYWSDAVLIGANTAVKDDPRLTVRLVEGVSPYRIVVSSSLRVDPTHRLFSVPEKSILMTTERWNEAHLKKYTLRGIGVIQAGLDRVDLYKGLCELRKRGIKRILVEGGGRINYSLLSMGLVDEVWVTIAPEVFGSGVSVFQGEGVDGFMNKIELALMEVKMLCGGWVNLRYNVVRPKKVLCRA